MNLVPVKIASQESGVFARRVLDDEKTRRAHGGTRPRPVDGKVFEAFKLKSRLRAILLDWHVVEKHLECIASTGRHEEGEISGGVIAKVMARFVCADPYAWRRASINSPPWTAYPRMRRKTLLPAIEDASASFYGRFSLERESLSMLLALSQIDVSDLVFALQSLNEYLTKVLQYANCAQ